MNPNDTNMHNIIQIDSSTKADTYKMITIPAVLPFVSSPHEIIECAVKPTTMIANSTVSTIATIAKT